MAAVGVCMHKIARILYGMLKHNCPYDAQVDRRNRQNNSGQRKARMDRSRRYQDYDPAAPVSRRQKKKRMERERSHSDISTKCGIQSPVPLTT